MGPCLFPIYFLSIPCLFPITVNLKPCPKVSAPLPLSHPLSDLLSRQVGSKHYQHMDIERAVFPHAAALDVGFLPDESPDVLLPIGKSGFRPDAPYEEYRHN